MREEIITSGRMNLNIDPVLNIWHWEIPIYLFLGGLAAGLLFFAALFVIIDKEDDFSNAVKAAPIFAPISIGVGLLVLLLDLKHPLYAWQLYTTIRFVSPMSWGAWTLLLVMPLSFAWVFMYIDHLFPTAVPKISPIEKMRSKIITIHHNTDAEINWEFKILWLKNFKNWLYKNRLVMAWIVLPLSIILGVYTGILLSAFNARPLWNTAILGPLFLTSGLSTAAASIMWVSDSKKEKTLFSKVDLILILVELFFITHLFMGMLASSQVHVEAAHFFLGGEFTTSFWLFVVGFGLVIPALLEVLELRGHHIHTALPAILILFGGLVFRFLMVEAGQMTRFLY